MSLITVATSVIPPSEQPAVQPAAQPVERQSVGAAPAAVSQHWLPLLRWRHFLRTPKGLLLLVFLPLLLVAGSAQGWSSVLPHVAAAVAGACLVDLLVARIALRTWFWPSGALLSGMIVAFVLGPETAWPVTLAVGVLATASKHILEWRRVHLFNPAALALLVSIPLFATGQSWWGALAELPWPWLLLVLAGGLLVVDRINRFPLVLSFTGSYFALFTLVGMVNPVGAAEMFRPPFLQAVLFLALFMLTDPPTAPARYADQVGVGVLVAVVSTLAQLAGLGQAYLLIGLLAGNLALAGRRWLGMTRTPGVPGVIGGRPSPGLAAETEE